MRFIRDIIGEKMKTEDAISGASASAPANGHVAAPFAAARGDADPGAMDRQAWAISAEATPPLASDMNARTDAQTEDAIDDLFRAASPDAPVRDDLAAVAPDAPLQPSSCPSDQMGDTCDEAENWFAGNDASETGPGAIGAINEPSPQFDRRDAAGTPNLSAAIPEPSYGEPADRGPLLGKSSQPHLPQRGGVNAGAEVSAPKEETVQTVAVPEPAAGRRGGRDGRAKTRLLGFNVGQDIEIDPNADTTPAATAAYTTFPVGWLIVIEGAGRGSAFTLFNGVSNIGRGENQTVRLDFGDNSISRENHAAIAYDPRQKSFFIGHGGKANLVRRNDRPVLSTEELAAGDQITIGETTLRFVPFCGPDFSWEETREANQAYAAQT